MEREIYATDGEIIIYHLSEEDMEDYFRLCFDDEEMIGMYREGDKFVRSLISSYVERNYSIYDSNNEYCGNIEFQHSKSDTPEIGIELVEEKRNRGMGPKAIKLFARATYNKRDIKYFILRAERKNYHSNHVIEKLGAVYSGIEENKRPDFITKLEELIAQTIPEKAKEFASSLPDENEEIMVYKYMPEAFLDK